MKQNLKKKKETRPEQTMRGRQEKQNKTQEVPMWCPCEREGEFPHLAGRAHPVIRSICIYGETFKKITFVQRYLLED